MSANDATGTAWDAYVAAIGDLRAIRDEAERKADATFRDAIMPDWNAWLEARGAVRDAHDAGRVSDEDCGVALRETEAAYDEATRSARAIHDAVVRKAEATFRDAARAVKRPAGRAGTQREASGACATCKGSRRIVSPIAGDGYWLDGKWRIAYAYCPDCIEECACYYCGGHVTCLRCRFLQEGGHIDDLVAWARGGEQDFDVLFAGIKLGGLVP